MTQKQFMAALEKHGMVYTGIGYVRVTRTLHVYPGNAGERLRSQLAYLLRERDRDEAKDAARRKGEGA